MHIIKVTLSGVGYKVSKADEQTLQLHLGYSHPIYISLPLNISINYVDNQEFLVASSDKQIIGEFCSVLRTLRTPEPYKNKGVILHFKKNIQNLQKRKKTIKK